MTDRPVTRHTIFQNSLMTALLDGIYDGEMTVGELLGKGNFGLGTFDALDGEMVIIDGTCYQLRHDGSATRAVVRQSKPYPPMTQAVGDDAEQHFTDVSGVIAGFRTPVFEKGISVPGCHVHFIDDGRTVGGHVLDFTLAEGKIELCPGADLDLRLPLNSTFSEANLDPEDLDEQLHATEVKD